MIIGLAGYAGSGKDSVGDILIQKHGFRRVAFADKIRSFLYDINPQVGDTNVQSIVSEQGWNEAKKNPEIRRLLQDTGIAGRNLFGEDIWIWETLGEVVYSAANTNSDGGSSGKISENIVVTDVRFENEFTFIQDFGGKLWQVARDGVGPINDHISETDLIGQSFDVTLNNSSSLTNLELLVDAEIQKLKETNDI